MAAFLFILVEEHINKVLRANTAHLSVEVLLCACVDRKDDLEGLQM
jgi:hypothetical protein